MVLNGWSVCLQVRKCKSIHIITLHFSNNHFNVYFWFKFPRMFLSFPLPTKIYFIFIILTHATYLILLELTPLIMFCAQYNNTALSPSLPSSQANKYVFLKHYMGIKMWSCVPKMDVAFVFCVGHTMHILNIKTCLYAYSIHHINGCELVLEVAHCHAVLILQRCNFMLINFRHFRILIFLITSVRTMQYLDQHAGLAFLYSKRLSENGIMVPKHVGVWYFSWLELYKVHVLFDTLIFYSYIAYRHHWEIMFFYFCSIIYKRTMSVRFTNIAIGNNNVGVLYYVAELKFFKIL